MHSERFYPPFTLNILFASQLLCVFYVLGIFYYLKTRYQKQVAFLSIGILVAAIFIVKFSFAQYYAPAIPLMALIAGYALYQVLEGHLAKILLLLLTLSASPFISYSYTIAKMIIKKTKNEQHEKINYVLSITNPNDYVYDGKSFFNVFRHDIDYFWFEARMNHEKSALAPLLEKLINHTYDLYGAIDRFKPKIISTYYINRNHPIIKQSYRQSDNYEDLLIRKT